MHNLILLILQTEECLNQFQEDTRAIGCTILATDQMITQKEKKKEGK